MASKPKIAIGGSASLRADTSRVAPTAEAAKRSFRNKIGHTLLGVSLMSGGMAFMFERMGKMEDPQHRLWTQAAAVAWCVLIVRVLRIYVWMPERSASVAIAQGVSRLANGRAVASAKEDRTSDTESEDTAPRRRRTRRET